MLGNGNEVILSLFRIYQYHMCMTKKCWFCGGVDLKRLTPLTSLCRKCGSGIATPEKGGESDDDEETLRHGRLGSPSA